ncbi:MAG: ribonuclease P protein subunit [Candidatus Hodarchaeales archaeon]|jgi:RNase P/RNase MRP subunit p29
MKKKSKQKKNKRKISLDEVISDLLIGEKITIIVTSSSSPTKKQKLSGLVIDESKNMITIKLSNNELKQFPKQQIEIERYFQKQKLIIKGSKLKGRPEERLKLELKKKW